MKAKIKHIILYSIQIFLMAFWLYVALDKLWDLPNFHRSLLKQPFPDSWADVLYWSLPLAELGIALLFVTGSTSLIIQRSKTTSESGKRGSTGVTLSMGTPFLLSALLLLVFTVYIGLGVAGLYAKRPCGCASIFSGLSWEWHLLVNLALVGLSILGWYLTGPTAPMDKGRTRYKRFAKLFLALILLLAVPIYAIIHTVRRRFPKRFAPFPGRPVGE